MSLVKLQKMIDSGKTYYYRNQATVIKGFDSVHGEIEILVEINGQPQKFIKEDETKLEHFLTCFTEIPETRNDQLMIAYRQTIFEESKEQFKSLTTMLVDDITKVRNDPKYVNQAKQVCNNISAIVNITKLQMQLLKNG